MERAGRLLVTVVVGVLAMTGCGSGEPAAGPSSTTSGTPTPTGDRSESGGDEPLPCVPDVDRVRVPASLDEDDAMAAYCSLVDLTDEHGFTRLVIPREAASAQDFAPVRSFLTEPARNRWDAAVQAWLTDRDPRAGALLDGLVLHDVAVPPGYRVDPDGAIAFGTQAGQPTVRPAGAGEAMKVRFPVETGLVLVREGDTSGRHSLLPVTRRATYVVVPDGDRWLVDAWRARFERGPVRLVSGG